MVYPISRFWFNPLCRILIRKINGTNNIPINSNFIIISNHEKLIDPFLILYPVLKKLNKKIHFIATPTWWFLGETICRKWLGCIPLFNSEQAYNEAKNYVKSGKIVGICPEGHLNAKIRYPKTGAVRLALDTKMPILPIGIKSSYLPFSSEITIGKPVHLKKGKNIKDQTLDLMKHVYRLRNCKHD